MKRIFRILALSLPFLAAATPATAQFSRSIEVQRFKPGAGPEDVLAVESARTNCPKGYSFGLYSNWANDPFRLVSSTGSEIKIITRQIFFDLAGSWSPVERLDLGLVLPVSLNSAPGFSKPIGTFVTPPDSKFGVGDLRLYAKYRAWEYKDFSLAAEAILAVPTGDGKSFLGQGGVVFYPKAILEYDFHENGRLLGNLSFPLRGTRSYANLETSTAFDFGLAYEYPFKALQQNLALVATFEGETNFKKTDIEELPMEALGGLRWFPADSMVATLAAGRGVTNGYGAPNFRLVGSFTYRCCTRKPQPVVRETTGTIMGDVSDTGGNPLAGSRVAISREGKTAERVLPDGHLKATLETGTYDVTASADGYEPETASVGVYGGKTVTRDFRLKKVFVPVALEGTLDVAVTDQSGLPLLAAVSVVSDGQEKASKVEQAPLTFTLAPGDYTVRTRVLNMGEQEQPVKIESLKSSQLQFTFVKEEAPAPVQNAVLAGNRINLAGTVYFATGKATILSKSFPLLDEVAGIIRDNPDIHQVEIGGHTDSRGDDMKNKALSQRRADAVREYLIKKGIERGRLTAVGYGEEVPVQSPDDTEEKRQANRRVEFLIVK